MTNPQSDNEIKTLARRICAGIVIEVAADIQEQVGSREQGLIDDMKAVGFFDGLSEKLLKQLIDGPGYGVPKLREHAHRNVLSQILQITVPPYSTKTNDDPVEYFKRNLCDKFRQYGLPIGCLDKVSPNLAFVLKKQKRISEATALLNGPCAS